MIKSSKNVIWHYCLAICLVLTLFCQIGFSQDSRDTVEPTQEISLWSTVTSGGVIGYFILLMSLVATAFVIEHFMSIRRSQLIPDDLEERLEPILESRKIAEAKTICDEHGSYLAIVISSGLSHFGSMLGFYDMQTAMQEASERELSRLYRKLEYLSFIAATAPMLGLLGTVTGMIASFNQIAISDGAAKPSQLADGISEALVTTCLGLIIAIPTMFFVSFFRNRIDSYVAEAETVVERLMGRFRKSSNL